MAAPNRQELGSNTDLAYRVAAALRALGNACFDPAAPPDDRGRAAAEAPRFALNRVAGFGGFNAARVFERLL